MEKKNILITGGNKGIGLETTKMLLELGHHVTILARDGAPVKGLKNCDFIEYDLQNVRGISELISNIGKIDILINNSGIMNTCPFNNYSIEEKDRLMKINLD